MSNLIVDDTGVSLGKLFLTKNLICFGNGQKVVMSSHEEWAKPLQGAKIAHNRGKKPQGHLLFCLMIVWCEFMWHNLSCLPHFKRSQLPIVCGIAGLRSNLPHKICFTLYSILLYFYMNVLFVFCRLIRCIIPCTWDALMRNTGGQKHLSFKSYTGEINPLPHLRHTSNW